MSDQKIGILTRGKFKDSGVGIFEKNVVKPLLEKENFVEIPIKPSRSYPLSRTVHSLQYEKKVKKKVKQKGIDKFFVPTQKRLKFNPEKIPAEIIPYIHDIAPATTCYWDSDKSMIDYIKEFAYQLQVKKYISAIAELDEVIVASDSTGQELERRTKFSGKTTTVYQGVDNLPDIEYEGERDIDLIFVGSTIERKNPQKVKKVLKEAESQGMKVATVEFEDQDLPGETYTDISDEKLAELYSRSKYILHLSLIEGFGRAPVEAQRYGCMPLALDIEINREVLGNEHTNWMAIEHKEDLISSLKSKEPVKAKRIDNNFFWRECRQNIIEVLKS
jgi:glycosyltransferase involved in cell wall biosynthesis